MSARVEGGHLSVKFADGQIERWKLPDRSDKEAIRSIRDFAVTFARDQEATLGQINAVKKALTEEGYHLTKRRESAPVRSELVLSCVDGPFDAG